MKYSFHTIKLKDLEGQESKDANVHKVLANILYRGARDLDLIEVSQLMNKGKEVEMNESQINELKVLVIDEKNGLFAFVQKTVLDYIDSVK